MEKVNISGVPETMLQTMYARAKESKKENHIIYDAKAIEIAESLEYDFGKADKDAAMSTGVIARTLLLDKMVKQYIDEHPDCLVINIACGLDTRFYRLDNGKIKWHNIDLPQTIAVREKFFEEKNGRVEMTACSAMEESWAENIHSERKSTLVIIEGLTMYLKESDVKQILDIIARHFSDVTVLMETLSPTFVGKDVEKSIKASKASFTWGIKSGEELVKLVPDYKWIEDRSLVEAMKEIYGIYKVIGRIPVIKNLSNKICVLYHE